MIGLHLHKLILILVYLLWNKCHLFTSFFLFVFITLKAYDWPKSGLCTTLISVKGLNTTFRNIWIYSMYFTLLVLMWEHCLFLIIIKDEVQSLPACSIAYVQTVKDQ